MEACFYGAADYKAYLAFLKRAGGYLWSSCQPNALGKMIQLMTPHPRYVLLGKTGEERQQAYRALFRGRIPEQDLTAIRETTNKPWALGGDQFRRQIEAKTGRRAVSLGRGGDRRSEKYRRVKNQ